MACPFFLPMEKLEDGVWPHASRLPLGCGWSGQCTAPGHEGEAPSLAELTEFCNLGYAKECSRLPQERAWDSVRFAVRAANEDGNQAAAGHIQVRYVCEREHRPAEHGWLTFDAEDARWMERHPDGRVQKMAECFLDVYVEKRKRPRLMEAAS